MADTEFTTQTILNRVFDTNSLDDDTNANPNSDTELSEQAIWNRAFDSSTNQLRLN